MAESGSFIPQQSTPRPTKVRRRRIYVLSYVVYTFFIGVIITTAAVVFLRWQLVNESEAQQAALAAERTRFDQSELIRIQETESLLALVRYLIDHQPAVTKLLAALEDVTVEQVQLTEFAVLAGDDASQDEAAGGIQSSITAKYVGTSDSFSTLLAQREVMQAHPLLGQATISDVTLGEADTANSQVPEDTSNAVSYSVSLTVPVQDVLFDGQITPVIEETVEAEVSVVDTADESATSSPSQ